MYQQMGVNKHQDNQTDYPIKYSYYTYLFRSVPFIIEYPNLHYCGTWQMP